MPASQPILYGLASCDSCRKARRWLDEHGIGYRLHDLRTDGVTVQMLERWAGRVDWRHLLNTQSITWRRLPEVDRNELSASRALALMLEHPTLVKRPVLEHRSFIVVGFTPERYEEIISGK